MLLILLLLQIIIIIIHMYYYKPHIDPVRKLPLRSVLDTNALVICRANFPHYYFIVRVSRETHF